jgi:hypothetical protein
MSAVFIVQFSDVETALRKGGSFLAVGFMVRNHEDEAKKGRRG